MLPLHFAMVIYRTAICYGIEADLRALFLMIFIEVRTDIILNEMIPSEAESHTHFS